MNRLRLRMLLALRWGRHWLALAWGDNDDGPGAVRVLRALPTREVRHA